MSAAKIDTAFACTIAKKGIEKKLGISANNLYAMRSKLKNNLLISEATKLSLLVKTGWRIDDDDTYTRRDLISLVNFVLNTSEQARKFGAEYCLEKWENAKK